MYFKRLLFYNYVLCIIMHYFIYFILQNVILYNPDDTENTYYEQYNTCAGSVKTGDFVYVATDGGRQQIAQVDSFWSTKE